MSERRLSDAELARLEDMTFLEALGTTPGHQLFKLAIAELKSRRATPTPDVVLDVVLMPKELAERCIGYARIATAEYQERSSVDVFKNASHTAFEDANSLAAMLLASPSSGSARDK